MNAFHAVVTLIAALVVNAAVAQPSVTPGPSQPVKVTNDGSSPVPVTVNGGVAVSGPVTVNGSVAVSGPVNVGNTTANPVPVNIQGGTPVSVTITGTPVPTTVQGTATVTGSVNVTNQNLLVDVLNDSQNAPFNKTRSFSGNGSISGGDLAFSVPPGQRLIIETITIFCRIEALGSQPYPLYKLTNSQNDLLIDGAALGPLTRVASGGGFPVHEDFVALLPMKMRLNGGDTFEVEWIGVPANTRFFTRATVHGYLVPM